MGINKQVVNSQMENPKRLKTKSAIKSYWQLEKMQIKMAKRDDL